MNKSNLPQTNPTLIGQKELLTRKETFTLLAIDPSTLHRWTKSGKLKSVGIGNRVYYRYSQIMEESLQPLN
jgi:predicted site-specific integrase-resolvase